MAIRVGVNGFGRIGRLVLRAAMEVENRSRAFAVGFGQEHGDLFASEERLEVGSPTQNTRQASSNNP